MILAALMFVFGAWVVQQMAQLPSLAWMVFASLAASMIFITQANPRFFRYFQLPKFLKIGLFSIAAFLFGVCWASSFAVWRMSDELPHAWEQKTIAIEGVVASLPKATERGERFRFDVEKILTTDAIVPRHISLNQYRANQCGSNNESEEDTTQFSQFHAGER